MISSASSSLIPFSSIVIGPPGIRSPLMIFVWPTRAHSARISRTVAFVAFSETWPPSIRSWTSARAGAAHATMTAASKNAASTRIVQVYAPDLGPPSAALSPAKRLDDLHEDIVEAEFRVISDHRARLRQVGHAARHVLESGLVGLVVRHGLNR